MGLKFSGILCVLYCRAGFIAWANHLNVESVFSPSPDSRTNLKQHSIVWCIGMAGTGE